MWKGHFIFFLYYISTLVLSNFSTFMEDNFLTLLQTDPWVGSMEPLITFLPQFEKIKTKSFDQGVVTIIFQMRGHEKLETWKFLFLLKMADVCREYNFRSEKNHFW